MDSLFYHLKCTVEPLVNFPFQLFCSFEFQNLYLFPFFIICSSSLSYSICWLYHVLIHARLLATPWIVAHQLPPSMRFPRQEYWSRDAISYYRESFWLRDQTRVYYIGRWILYHWATREAIVVAAHVIKYTL